MDAPPACDTVTPLAVADGAPPGDGAVDVAALRAWAETQQADRFAGMWMEDGNVLTVAFTGTDVDALQRDVAERFGPARVVGGARNTYADLAAAQARLHEQFQSEFGSALSGSGVRDPVQLLAVDLLAPTDEQLARLSDEFPGLLCVTIEAMPTEADAQVAAWEPAPGADLSPTSQRIDVLLMEFSCSGGTDAVGRVATPDIQYTADAVVVTLRVIPRPGPQPCPGNPPTPFTLELAEPLGDRELLDGGVDPPGPPDLERPFRSDSDQ